MDKVGYVLKQEQHWRTEGRPAFGSNTTKAIGAICPHQQRPVGTDEEGSAGSETATGLARMPDGARGELLSAY
jgi:hypothetical protein